MHIKVVQETVLAIKWGYLKRMSANWGGGREGVSNSVDKCRQGETRGLAVSGHPFQCDLCKREEGT